MLRPVYLPTYPFSIFLSISNCLSIYLSIYLAIYVSILLHICLSTYLRKYPSVYLCFHVSIYPCSCLPSTARQINTNTDTHMHTYTCAISTQAFSNMCIRSSTEVPKSLPERQEPGAARGLIELDAVLKSRRDKTIPRSVGCSFMCA